MRRLLFTLTLLCLTVISPALAQDEPGELPTTFRLEGLTQIWQMPNRCASGALAIQLSYFGFSGEYYDVIEWLSPNSEDVSVRLEEMAAFAELQGLRSVIRTGGTIDLLKTVVNAGFPVLVENVYYDGPNAWDDWMSHNRVMMGYDSEQVLLYFYDSLRGNGEGAGLPMEVADFDERWRPFNRNYLILYFPEDEELLAEALGPHWDPVYNAEWTLQQAQSDLEGPHQDSFSWFNVGSALVDLGRYEEAAEAYDHALSLGLPWRMLWYQFGPFEAYLAVERYQEAADLVRYVLGSTMGVEEMYYYIGRAYEGQGNIDRAIANYEVAVFRNGHFTEAAEALAALQNTDE